MSYSTIDGTVVAKTEAFAIVKVDDTEYAFPADAFEDFDEVVPGPQDGDVTLTIDDDVLAENGFETDDSEE